VLQTSANLVTGCKTKSKICKTHGRYLACSGMTRQKKVRSIGLQRKRGLEGIIPISGGWKIKFGRVGGFTQPRAQGKMYT